MLLSEIRQKTELLENQFFHIDDINKLIKDFGLKRPGEEIDESNDIKD